MESRLPETTEPRARTRTTDRGWLGASDGGMGGAQLTVAGRDERRDGTMAAGFARLTVGTVKRLIRRTATVRLKLLARREYCIVSVL